MIRPIRSAALAVSLTSTLGACASIPRDSGFADVRRVVMEETQQAVEWNPRDPVAPPDDAKVTAMLDQELTADDAVRLAFANNRDVQATLEELGIARGDLIAASTIRNPVFDGELRFPGDPAKPFETALTQTVVDIFQLGNRKKLGRAQFEATRIRVGAAVVNFAGEVRQAYYGLLAARKVLAREETVMKAQEAATELARRQHDAGNVSDLDLENEQARYEEAKLELARAQLDELTAREQLIGDLGLQKRAELKLLPEFPPLPETEMTSDEIEAQVMTRRLDIQITQREIEAAQRAIRLAKTAGFEDLAVGVHIDREADGKHTTGPGATIPIPIFDRGKAKQVRARAMLRQAQQRLAALATSARSEARGAQERLLEARSRVAYLRDVVVPRRARILNLTQLEYNAMHRGVFQLIDARKNLARAQRDEVMAARDYWVARTELRTALLGVARFTVRPDTPPGSQPDISPARTKQSARAHE